MTRLEGAGGEAPRGRQGGDRAYVTRNYDPVSGTSGGWRLPRDAGPGSCRRLRGHSAPADGDEEAPAIVGTEVAGHSKNNQRKTLNGRGWKKGEGKPGTREEVAQGAVPLTKRLPVALMVPVRTTRMYCPRAAWPCSRDAGCEAMATLGRWRRPWPCGTSHSLRSAWVWAPSESTWRLRVSEKGRAHG